MSRIVAVWELGANLGHIDRLLPVARELRGRGHEVFFVLRDLSRAHPRIAAEGFAMGQAPVWLPRMAHAPRLVNYAMVLAEAGWMDATGLAGLLSGWQAWLDVLRPDALICDHAPTALLAARGSAVPLWTLGSSFEQPPAGSHFPPMAFWEPTHAAACAASDATLLPPVNQALALLGRPPLPRPASLFDGCQQALATLPELAHYDGYPVGTEFCGPLYRSDGGITPAWPTGDGPRVFVYLAPTHPEFRALMAALRQLDLVALVHAPGLSEEAATRLGGPRQRLEAQPLRLSEVLAQATLVVSHGGLGTCSAALLAGKPQLLLPNHMEQAMVGRRVAAAGLGIAVPISPPAARPGDTTPRPPGPDWPALLRRLLDEPRFTAAAQAAAARHAGHTPQGTARRVADLIEGSLKPG